METQQMLANLFNGPGDPPDKKKREKIYQTMLNNTFNDSYKFRRLGKKNKWNNFIDNADSLELDKFKKGLPNKLNFPQMSEAHSFITGEKFFKGSSEDAVRKTLYAKDEADIVIDYMKKNKIRDISKLYKELKAEFEPLANNFDK